jgi:hypothetical protein
MTTQIQLNLVKQHLITAGAVIVGLALAAMVALAGDPADIVKKASNIGKTPGDLSGFVNAADALVSPAIVGMAAVTPLACLVGAGMMMFGSKKGLVAIGAALGTLVFVASIKGIVA